MAGFLGNGHEMSLGKEQFMRIRTAFEALDTYSHQLLLNAFQGMGVFREPGETISINALFERLKILPEYGQLFGSLLKMLERAGFVQITDETQVVALAGCANPELSLGNWVEKAEMLEQQYPVLKNRLPLLCACVEAYPDVLRGLVAPEKILFPEGVEQSLENFVDNDPLGACYRALLTRQLEQVIQNRQKQSDESPMVIVEAGSAPANKSLPLLEMLSELEVEVVYYWTDPSERLKDIADAKLARKFPFVRFQKWDIESEPEAWPFEQGTVDVLIGNNALHKAKSISTALEHAKTLLKSRGLLLLNESTVQDDFTTLTRGMLPSYWQFEDKAWRISGSPLLKSSSWKSVFINHGFGPVRIYHLKEDEHDAPNQMIISGESPATAEEQAARSATLVPFPIKSKKQDTPPHLKKPVYSEKSIIDMQPEAAEENDQTEEAASGETEATNTAEPMAAESNPSDVIPLVDEEGLPLAVAQRVNEPIAVIGMGGAYPMAEDVDAFWDLLKQGRIAFQEIPTDRLELDGQDLSEQIKQSNEHLMMGGFLSDIDKFDPYVFKLTPEEADSIDPQERILLQAIWTAFENGGYTRARVEALERETAEGVGVFVGCSHEQFPYLFPQEDGSRAPFNRGSIANRIAYFFKLHGPSLVIDAADTSALAALHSAVESIQSGECAMAVVGGVFLNFDLENASEQHDSAQDKSSPEADAFVKGEGTGAVLLKTLAQAEKDGDRILGLIRATGVQASRHSDTDTENISLLQESFMRRLFRKSGIVPQDVSYLELAENNSTGENEVGLDTLGRVFHGRAQTLPVGCVRGNIGDLQSATGMSQLTKVLLQLKHRMLVPSLHASMDNAKESLKALPFAIHHRLSEWELEDHPEGHRGTRHAMISALGMGGVQAHVLLSEYVQPTIERTQSDENQDRLFVFSARNKDSLQEMARNFADYLGRFAQDDQPDLDSLAYTLQVGRELMNERAAFIVNELGQLIHSLESFSTGVEAIPNAYFGNAENGFSDHNFLLSGDSGKSFLQKLISEEEWGRIAYLWVTGADIPWRELYEGHTIYPLDLPTYPFAKISCRLPNRLGREQERRLDPALENEDKQDSRIAKAVSRAPFKSNTPVPTSPVFEGLAKGHLSSDDDHNLIGRLDTTLTEHYSDGVVFRKVFHPDHPAVDANRLPGFRMVPSVVFLEMALAALSEACGMDDMGISQVIWMQPLIVPDEGVEVRTLIKEQHGGLRYTIESGSLEGPVVLGKGCFEETVRTVGKMDSKLSLRNIQDEYARIWNSEDLYRKFEELGLSFDPYFKSVQLFWLWDEEAVGRLELTEEAAELERGYTLSPSLVDGALQIAAGMVALSGAEALIPFSVDNVRIHNSLPNKCYVLVKRNENERFDLHLMDENWSLCAELSSFAMCLPKGESDNIYYHPVWEEYERTAWEVSLRKEHTSHLILYTPEARDMTLALQGVILEYGGEVASFPLATEMEEAPDFNALLAPFEKVDRVYFLGLSDLCPERSMGKVGPTHQRFSYLMQLLNFLNALDEKGNHDELSIKIVTNDAVGFANDPWVNEEGAALGGLGISEVKGHANWKVACVDISLNEWLQGNQLGITEMILEMKAEHEGGALAFRHGKCYRRILIPASLSNIQMSTFRQKGVYVILGGPGSVSGELCRYLAQHYEAELVILGWPPSDAAFQQLVEEVQYLGGVAQYWPVDATSEESVSKAVAEAKEKFGQIHGVVHAGFVLQDAVLNRVDEEIFGEMLRSTVDATSVLVEVMRDEPLDFFLFFSSFQSFATIAGQGIYASASLALDGCAFDLGLDAEFPVKIVNWGYWEDEKGLLSEEYRRFLLQQGIFPIEVDMGMKAIELILDQPNGFQYVVTKISPELENKLNVARSKQWRRHTLYSTNVYDARRSSGSVEEVLPAAHLSEERVEVLQTVNETLDDLGASCLIDTLQVMGIFRSTSEKYTLEVLQENLRIVPPFKMLLPALLDVLVRAGYLEREGVRYKATSQVQMNLRKYLRRKIDHRIETIGNQYPDFEERVEMLQNCLKVCPRIIKGSITVEDILFSDGNQALYDRVYRNDAVTEFLMRSLVAKVRELVSASIEHLPEKTKINILELGAGTGGLSALMLKALAPFGDHVIYAYTDLAKPLAEGRRKEILNRYPFLEFKELNIENDPAMQGFAPGSVDIILSNNVLHRSRCIQRSLSNVKKLLKGKGVLYLNEVTERRDYATFTVGLSHRWWQFEDSTIRISHSPFLTAEGWCEQLSLAGFKGIAVSSMAKEFQHVSGQHLISGASDGSFIEQKRMEYSEAVSEMKHKSPSMTSSPIDPRKGSPLNRGWSEGSMAFLTGMLSMVLDIDADEIDLNTPFEQYGVDADKADEINSRLEDKFGSLPNTLLFEYPTVNDLCTYLEEHFPEKVKE